MLINQARNLASLPYSSLQQLQHSIQRTQQLLGASAEHRLRRPADRSGVPDHVRQRQRQPIQIRQLDRQTRERAGRTPSAALQDALRVQAGVVGNIDTNRTQMSALVTSSQAATGAPCRRRKPATSFSRLRRSSSPTSRAAVAAQGRAQSLQAAQQAAAAGPGPRTAPPLP